MFDFQRKPSRENENTTKRYVSININLKEITFAKFMVHTSAIVSLFMRACMFKACSGY